jgi:hypothetical protein
MSPGSSQCRRLSPAPWLVTLTSSGHGFSRAVIQRFLLKQSGGFGFGVFDPKRQEKAKQALEEFLKTDRVLSMHSPDYRAEADLGALLTAAVAQRCAAIQMERAEPHRERP